MKVLAINSSARKDGNTAILLERVLKELRKEGVKTAPNRHKQKDASPARDRRLFLFEVSPPSLPGTAQRGPKF